MRILLGNQDPHEIVNGVAVVGEGPCVVYTSIDPFWGEDERWHPGYIPGTNATDILRHIAQNPGPVKKLGGNEILGEVLGDWDRYSGAAPTWVAVVHSHPYDDAVGEDLERCIADYWDCARGVPEDVEETHWTLHGGKQYPPGEKPEGE